MTQPGSALAHIGKIFAPSMGAMPFREITRAGICACIGMTALALLISNLSNQYTPDLMLIAPIGATAVLVFAAPNSPLAQPWSAIIGNSASALWAIYIAHTVPDPWQIYLAVGGAICIMGLLRAIHPPGGAVALLIALEAQTTSGIPYSFAFAVVALLTSLIVLFAVPLNQATGRQYPFRRPDDEDHISLPRNPISLSPDKLEELLARFNQSTNLGVEDLGRLLAAAEMEVASQRFKATKCSDIMTIPVLTVTPATPLHDVWEIYCKNNIKSIPVVNIENHLAGIVSHKSLLTWAMQEIKNTGSRPFSKVSRRFHHKKALATDIMDRSASPVSHNLPVGALLTMLSEKDIQLIPVLDGKKLVGIITRHDIIKLLTAEIGTQDIA